ncbi:MAG: polyprenyl synthetase family protein [Myxococcaceae bacterium]
MGALPDALTRFLTQVEARLNERLSRPPGTRDTLMQAARHLCLLPGGKRGRPILVHTFAEALGVTGEPVLEIAVGAELIHSASLLHDDVVDAGMFRRGRPTANAQWGNLVSVMAGDLLLSDSLLRLNRLSPAVGNTALETVREMTWAAIAEIESRGDLSHSQAALASVAEGKTGSLFGWCGKAIATLAGEAEAARCFDAFGRELGIAFQIADDIRDVTGTDPGKPRYQDIVSRTPSLPIALAVKHDEHLRKRISEAWAPGAMNLEKAKELGTALWCTGAIDEATQVMELHLSRAVDALGPYREGPVGERLLHWAISVARGVALKDAA